MERSVGGLRDRFYRDLTEEYQERQTQSSLYRFFWRESMEELLKESLPRLLSQNPVPEKDLSELLARDFPDFLPEEDLCPRHGARVIEQLSGEMKKHPLEAGHLLLWSQSGKKRWDFWEKLQLNNAGYQAGLITDTEYYLWLVDCLAAHGAYYKETIKGAGANGENLNGHKWLLPLLCKVPPRLDEKTGKPIRPGWKKREKDGTFVFAAAQVERDLKRMADLIREEQAAGRTAISGQLHNLKITVRTAKGGERRVDYLRWLTGQLERMALHITIKNWLQYSGYPLVVYDGAEGRREKKGDRERKSDFSMRLFEAFCDSPEGYLFQRKKLGGAESWQVDGNGFCLLAPDQIAPLLESLRQSGRTYFYIPLAVDLYSGCTFFLAGKENYEEAYESAGKETRAAYQAAEERFCFDYLRLEPYPANLGGAFRLSACFHENAGKSFQTVLGAFKRYCMAEQDGPRQTLQQLNEDEPAGTPAPFRKAFE
ncbi:MAG: hypothetical protein HFG00_06240 [Oscillibacter sp.]|nr:hypothetical protein [Oscillibacter sp.]